MPASRTDRLVKALTRAFSRLILAIYTLRYLRSPSATRVEAAVELLRSTWPNDPELLIAAELIRARWRHFPALARMQCLHIGAAFQAIGEAAIAGRAAEAAQGLARLREEILTDRLPVAID